MNMRRITLHAVRWCGLAVMMLVTVAETVADCGPCWEWGYNHQVNGRPTTPAYVNGVIVQAVDGDVLLRRPDDGSFAATYPTPGMWRTPVLTSLPGSSEEDHWYVFAAKTDGYLVKLDVPALPPSPATATLTISMSGNVAQERDLRRAACPTDTLLAEPVVQRRVDSNAQFTLEKDIVMVATARACGDISNSQVWALDAADISQPPVWVFNIGDYEISRIRSCVLDLNLNRLHCVAEHPTGSFQISLFSIDTNTGNLMWGALPDRGVHAKPALGAPGGPGEGHLYVGDQSGYVHSFDADDGDPHGSLLVVPAADGVTPAVHADLNAAGGEYAGLVLAVGSNGKISALYDTGDELVEAWTSELAGGQKVVTEALALEELGKLYAGTDDGYIRQFNLSSGSPEAHAFISILNEDSITTDNMTVATYLGMDGFHHLVGTLDTSETGTQSRQWKLPCEYASQLCAPFWPGFKDGFENEN